MKAQIKTQIIADDLVVLVDTIQAAEPIWIEAFQLAKAQNLRYLTALPSNGDRPFCVSVRRMERNPNIKPHRHRWGKLNQGEK
ncbi:MAG TPA: hypothetical protein V6D29_15405 [Leptolyngbyaceae cyanobacterium]